MGSVFTDEQITAAMIDLLVHYGHMLIFSGRSHHIEHALMRHNAEVKMASDDC
jgi:DNA replication protein DnaC